jgi:hypothetical protein
MMGAPLALVPTPAPVDEYANLWGTWLAIHPVTGFAADAGGEVFGDVYALRADGQNWPAVVCGDLVDIISGLLDLYSTYPPARIIEEAIKGGGHTLKHAIESRAAGKHPHGPQPGDDWEYEDMEDMKNEL